MHLDGNVPTIYARYAGRPPRDRNPPPLFFGGGGAIRASGRPGREPRPTLALATGF